MDGSSGRAAVEGVWSPGFPSNAALIVTGVMFLFEGTAGLLAELSVASVTEGGDLSGVFTGVSISEVGTADLLAVLVLISSDELLRTGDVCPSGGDLKGLAAIAGFCESRILSDG